MKRNISKFELSEFNQKKKKNNGGPFDIYNNHQSESFCNQGDE
jgi:hypothetical protein